MTILNILLGIIKFFLGITPVLPLCVTEVIDKLNKQFMSLCRILSALDDDELVVALKPLTVLCAIMVLVLMLVLSKIWGPDDQDARELSFLFFGFLTFNGLVLNDREEFQNRVQRFFLKLKSVAKWSSFVCALILATGLAMSTQVGYLPTEKDIVDAFLMIFGPLFGALVILAFALPFAFILIPIAVRWVFVYITRWIIKFTITRFAHNPIQVPLLIASAIFLLINISIHLAGK